MLICNDDMNFEFDDTNEINEDTIIVTGFTVRSLTINILLCVYLFFLYFSKDNPLEFTFWRKMLRDVREQLKADALAKLMASCPTLFSMGWFKENLPKTEEEITKEDNDFSIQDKNHKHSLIN